MSRKYDLFTVRCRRGGAVTAVGGWYRIVIIASGIIRLVVPNGTVAHRGRRVKMNGLVHYKFQHNDAVATVDRGAIVVIVATDGVRLPVPGEVVASRGHRVNPYRLVHRKVQCDDAVATQLVVPV